jgi:hypothetical protein
MRIIASHQAFWHTVQSRLRTGTLESVATGSTATGSTGVGSFGAELETLRNEVEKNRLCAFELRFSDLEGTAGTEFRCARDFAGIGISHSIL